MRLVAADCVSWSASAAPWTVPDSTAVTKAASSPPARGSARDIPPRNATPAGAPSRRAGRGGACSAPELLGCERRALGERAKLRPRELRVNAAAQTAVGRGDHVLAPD